MDQPVIVERILNAPVHAVWAALTSKEEMKQWYFDLADFRPEPGFTFSFYGGTEENQYLHLCTVTEAIPERKITYSWRYDGYEGISYVSFELMPEGNTTRLKLTHTGLDSFPPLKDFARTNFEAGWNHIINTSLPGYVEKGYMHSS